MYRVIIVEDEFIVRYGIRSMIDWEKVGLRVIGEAANGKEALELMESELPDILITDIKMPVMDGLELIHQTRQISPDMKILILSNLEDFQYAKEAIKHGVSEYLIKSDMMPRDFEQSLLNIKNTLAAQEDAKSTGLTLFSQAEPIEKEKFWLNLIEGESSATNNLTETASLLGVSELQYPSYLLHINLNLSELGFSEKQATIRLALEEAWKDDHGSYELFSDKQGEMNILWMGKEWGSSSSAQLQIIRSKAENLIEVIGKRHGLQPTIGLSASVSTWIHLKDAYIQAVDAAKQRMFLGSGRVIISGVDYGEISTPAQDHIRISTNQIQSMVYAFQSKELKDYLDDIFKQLDACRDVDWVHIISLELLMMLTTIWPDVSSDAKQVLELKKEYFEQLSKQETLEQSKLWFIHAFEELIQHMIQVYNSDRNSIIKATQYIQQFYHQEISLQAISGLVHLSKNYFANLFKKEMGESFLEYLTRIRIEKAKSLLTGDLKTADVGTLVGIQDPKYFSKVFKKITGVSPSEYRSLIKEVR